MVFYGLEGFSMSSLSKKELVTIIEFLEDDVLLDEQMEALEEYLYESLK